MSRLHFKGGAWTNAEDQVLLAGLSQYGIRDWERVASLLVKKTAAQCRERWENYLDPRLNLKEAWSVEEEEKLVQLQTLFPNQWKLISAQLTRSTPNKYIRPAWLCEEHYLELKDAFDYEREQSNINEQSNAQSDDTHNNNNSNNNNSAKKFTFEEFMALRRRKRAPYKAHEEKPARSDIIANDMYEKEMIEMAISRLANQDQKKGLRKERQRQLEEARFLAKLENNREGLVSGTLSERQAKRIRRAIEEDAHGVTLTDNVHEETEHYEHELKEERKANKRVKKHGEFKPIDLNEEEARAGTSHKQRTLLKSLDGQNVNNNSDENSDDKAFHQLLGNRTGANAELLESLVSNEDKISVDKNNILTNKINMLKEKTNKVTTPALTWDALATSVNSSGSSIFAHNNNINNHEKDNNISNYLSVLEQSETPLTSIASAASSSTVPNLDLLFAELNADVTCRTDEIGNSKMLSDNNEKNAHVEENAMVESENLESDHHDKSNDQLVQEEIELRSTEHTETMKKEESDVPELHVEPSANDMEQEEEKMSDWEEVSSGNESTSSTVERMAAEHITNYEEELDKARRMIAEVMHNGQLSRHGNNLEKLTHEEQEEEEQYQSRTMNSQQIGSNANRMIISYANSTWLSQLQRAKEMIETEVHNLHKEEIDKNNTCLLNWTEKNKLVLRDDINVAEAMHELELKVRTQESKIRKKQQELLDSKAHWLISTFYDEGNDQVVHDLIQEREELMEAASTMESSSSNNKVVIYQHNAQIARINAKIINAVGNYWTHKLHSAQQELHFLRYIRAQEQQEMREQISNAQNTLHDGKNREKVLQAMYKEYRQQQQMLSEETRE